ncbi:MAG: CPBP family intramembrane metalloprotease [Thermotogae bacterium]|nr:CPBP family intramembrane metalloprotease [Thermotogota bacterium]
MKEKSDEIYVDFFDLLIILAINFPIFLLLAIFKYLGGSSDTLSAFLLILLSVLTVWGFHLILKQKGYGIGSWFRISSFGPDLIWSVIVFPGVFGVYFVMSFLTAFIWDEPIFSKMSMNPNAFVAVISLGLFFPVVEEVIFRGAIYGYLKHFFSPEFAIILTSVAFAVVHPFQDWMKLFVFGMLLNLLYYKRGTLTVSSTVHVMVNLIYLSIAYLPRV